MERTSKHFRKRDAILHCVRSTDAHPSADWVFEHVKEQIPDISLATVYRNLSLFKEQGLITSLGTVKGVERFDCFQALSQTSFLCSPRSPTAQPHDHHTDITPEDSLLRRTCHRSAAPVPRRVVLPCMVALGKLP